MYNTSKNDVKKLALNIEALAKELQEKIDKGENFLLVCNELVRNASTITFTAGEVYAMEQLDKNKSTKKVLPLSSSKHYHNVRDSLGRFKRV